MLGPDGITLANEDYGTLDDVLIILLLGQHTSVVDNLGLVCDEHFDKLCPIIKLEEDNVDLVGTGTGQQDLVGSRGA